jgi:hypothetical protein
MGLTFDAFHSSNNPAITIRTTEIIYTVIISLIKKRGMRGGSPSSFLGVA